MKTLEQTFHELTALISDQTRDLAIAMAELAAAIEKMDSLACVLDGCRIQRDAAVIERDNARQSLRAAEADAAEIDTLCNDFRRANSRLVADLAAAVQRADTAEAILRAKA
jgi:adenine-specific DNA glycosylase